MKWNGELSQQAGWKFMVALAPRRASEAQEKHCVPDNARGMHGCRPMRGI